MVVCQRDFVITSALYLVCPHAYSPRRKCYTYMSINKKRQVKTAVNHATHEDMESHFRLLSLGFKYNTCTEQISITCDKGQTWDSMHNGHDGYIAGSLRSLRNRLANPTDGSEPKILSSDLTNSSYIKECYATVAFKNRFSPIEDYLNKCLSAYKIIVASHPVPNDLFNFMASIKCAEMCAPNKEKFLMRWLMGAVKTVFQQPPEFQNELLIITGPQGIGKSTLFKKLCSGIREYYYTGMPVPGNRDSLVNLFSNFIWCWDELQAGAKGSSIDQDALKDFLSTEYIKVRTAYARHPIRKKRVASMCGTTNEKEIHNDATGERRKATLEVEEIDWDLLNSVDIDILWGTVYQILIDHNWTPISIKAEQEISNARFSKSTHLETFLRDHCIFGDHDSAIHSGTMTDFLYTNNAITNKEQAWRSLNNIMTRYRAVKKDLEINGKAGIKYWVGIKFKTPSALYPNVSREPGAKTWRQSLSQSNS